MDTIKDEDWWFLCPMALILDEDVAWRNYARSISYPPIPRSFNLWTTMGIWRVFFFLAVMALGVPPLHINFSVAAYMRHATCHTQISWGVSVPMRHLSFPTFFEAPFLNPLSSSSYFFIFLLHLLLWFLDFLFFLGMLLFFFFWSF